ncbi:hypothetical protein [Natrinema halophilum]|uniref:hypothetical protein n=1 Tax=Natrinema halophilum TaxID=1699371 RepID=UPI001F1F1C07|nr:hypothetical protein [Natrinema halophilum]UHQ96027.1 hypothetical protein HYG82_20860 [Natrinema halophilum]
MYRLAVSSPGRPGRSEGEIDGSVDTAGAEIARAVGIRADNVTTDGTGIPPLS